MKSSRLFSWFNRRSYSQKFIVIGLLFVVSLAGFYPMGRDQIIRRENYGTKELEGTLYLRPLQALLADLNKHHILALRVVDDPGAAEELAAQQTIINDKLAELAELDEKYGESLQLDIELVTIQDAWQTVLRAAEKQQPFEINAKHYQINKDIRRAITRVGNTSFLILDPDLDTYYMMDIALLRMPDFQDLLNQITLTVATADMQGEISEGKRLELITLSSKISTYLVQLRSSNKVSWDNDETGQMRQLTALPLNDLEAKLSAFINTVNAQIVVPGQGSLTPEQLAAAEAAQVAATAYYDSVSQALEYGINGRIQQLTDRLTFAITFAISIISIALTIGFILMRAISRPLNELAVAAGRLGAGERGVYIPVTGEDEVSRAGFAFNTMASELETAQNKQEAQLAQLTQLTKALETGAVISRRLSTILDQSQLLEAVITEIQRAFNYFHVHIYLLDEERMNLIMTRGTGEVGQKLLARGHKLALGQGLVGKAALMNVPVFVPDVSQDTSWLPNPLLLETKAEAAVPIALGDRVLGVLDVQHSEVGYLNVESVDLLQSVASQVAIALENADLFTERHRANEEMSKFKMALERSPNAIFMTDLNGTILYVNPGFEELYGFSTAEAVGQTPRILKSGLIPPEQYTRFWQTLLAKQPMTGEIVNKTKDGRFITVAASNNPIIAKNDELVGFLGLHNDVTERKRAESLLARQANELSTVARVGTTAATILDPDLLLQEVVDLTKTSFELYHAHIHLLNDSKDTLVLTAGAGEIGQKMVAEGRRIPLAAKGSLVATTARTRQGAIRNYDPPGEGFMPHPLLAETRCEMAVPIALGEEVLGILDVRSDKLNYFSEADMQTYTTLTAQIAVALQNARSFARSEQALKELSTLSRRLTREGWESYLDQTAADLHVAYDSRQVIKGKNENGRVAGTDSTMVQPITVLGEPIGQISVTEPQALMDDASEIIDAVANRLSAHIENLRLTAQTEMALAETAEQARRRAVLNQTSEQLNRAENLDDIFQIIAKSTAQILPSDRVSLALLNEKGDQFSVMSLVGDEANVPVRVDQPLAGSFIEKAVETGEILVTHDVQPNPTTGICSSMVVPLVTGSGMIGTLNVGSKKANVYAESDQDLILQIASILSSVIENKRLLTETQERARELAIINRVVSEVSSSLNIEQSLQIVADELAAATGVEAVAIALLNDDKAGLTVIADHYDPEHAGSSMGFVIPIEGNALTQEVLNTRRTILVEDAQNNPLTEPVHAGMRMRGVNTLYIIPMFAGNEIVGTVGIDILEKEWRLSPQQLRLAETIIFQAATAVQNARLFTQSEENAKKLAFINRIVTEINVLQDTRTSLQFLADKLGEILQAQSIVVLLTDTAGTTLEIAAAHQPAEFPSLVGVVLSAADDPIISQALQTRRMVIVEDVATSNLPPQTREAMLMMGTRSMYVIPMITGRDLIGVVSVNVAEGGGLLIPAQLELAETTVYQAAAAVQNARLFTQSEERAKELATINRIVTQMNTIQDVNASMQFLVDELGAATTAGSAVVNLINATGTAQEVVAAYLQEGMPDPVGTVIPIEGDPMLAQLLETRQTLVVDDVASAPYPPEIRDVILKSGFRSLYIIPMLMGRDLIGLATISVLQGDEPLTSAQIRLAETLVFQATSVVQNIRLYAQTEQRAAELSLINAVSELASSQLELPHLFESVGGLLQDTFAAESIYFALYDKAAEQITFPYFLSREDGRHDVAPRPLADGGFTGQIIESKTSLLMNWESDVTPQDVHLQGGKVVGGGRQTDSYLGTPMIVGNEVVGVVALSSYQEIRTYHEQDQRLLETLTDTIGVAIQNIRQFQAAQRRAEREALINSISQKIQAAPTVQSALQTAVSELGQALKLKKAAVALTPDRKDNGHTLN